MLRLTACVIGVVHGHMGITINTGAGEVFPREKASVGDAYRYPDLQASCHSTSAGGSVATVAAGDTISGTMTDGAAHGGGHCAWMISADQTTWHKINDKVHCTTEGTHDLVVPGAMPVDCSAGCVLGWFWTPMLSGGCEIYHNCFDITVTGTTVGTWSDPGPYTPGASPTCSYPDSTGLAPQYGAWVGPDGRKGGAAGTAPPVTDTEVKGCITHTVISGDTLTIIGEAYDVPWELVREFNEVAYPSLATNPNVIEIGWKLVIPQTAASVAQKKCVDTPADTADGASVATSQAPFPCLLLALAGLCMY